MIDPVPVSDEMLFSSSHGDSTSQASSRASLKALAELSHSAFPAELQPPLVPPPFFPPSSEEEDDEFVDDEDEYSIFNPATADDEEEEPIPLPTTTAAIAPSSALRSATAAAFAPSVLTVKSKHPPSNFEELSSSIPSSSLDLTTTTATTTATTTTATTLPATTLASTTIAHSTASWVATTSSSSVSTTLTAELTASATTTSTISENLDANAAPSATSVSVASSSKECLVLADAFPYLRISREDCCMWTRVQCEDGHIVELNLIEQNLQGEIPASLSQLSKLRDLLLSNNLLTGPLPESFGDLKELKNLWVAHNELSGSIPDTIANLPLLDQFHANNNNLYGKVPEALKHVQGISLANNCFASTDIPEVLSSRHLENGGYIFPQRSDCETSGSAVALPAKKLKAVSSSSETSPPEVISSSPDSAKSHLAISVGLPVLILAFAAALLVVLLYLRKRWSADMGGRKGRKDMGGAGFGALGENSVTTWEPLEDGEEDEDEDEDHDGLEEVHVEDIAPRRSRV